VAGYTSFFSGSGGSTTNTKSAKPAAPKTKRGYQSFFGSDTIAEPTQDELKRKRAAAASKQVSDKAAADAKVAEQKSKNGLINKVVKPILKSTVASEQAAATGVARILPGGTADLDAEKRRAEQANRNISLIKSTVKDKTKAKKIIQANADEASSASKSSAKTVKEMPTKTQVAAGIVGTGADILTAGSVSRGKAGLLAGKAAAETAAKKGAKEIIKKAAPRVAGNAVAGGANATAAGGDKKDIATNTLIGAVAPEVLGMAAKKVGSKMPKKISKEDRAQFLANSKAQSLIRKAQLTPEPEMPKPAVYATKTDGNVAVSTTPMKNITVAGDKAAEKVDASKVTQYVKQIKDGEKIAPVVINSKGELIDGKHRMVAAQKAGMDHIPTIQQVEGTVPAKAAQTVETPAVTAPVEKPVTPVTTPATVPKVTENGAVTPQIAKTGEVVEPAKRTLKPSETAHMEPVGGYTHSDDMVREYADTLRGQELQAKGGQRISDGEGGYKRTSEHSKFYREYYRENGKAPTKAAYAEEARRQLESGRDAFGAGKDYKQLIEREAKPVPRVKVEPAVDDVPTGKSKVGLSVQEKAVSRGLKDTFGDSAEYSKINLEDQARKAVAVTEDRQLLDDIIAGKEPLPDGLRATALIRAIEQDPKLSRDPDLILKLSKSKLASESSYSAQELRLARERDPDSAISRTKELSDARKKRYEETSGKKADTVQRQEAGKIERTATPLPVDAKTWDSFINSLKC
jgi:hypothetical protein